MPADALTLILEHQQQQFLAGDDMLAVLAGFVDVNGLAEDLAAYLAEDAEEASLLGESA